MSQKTVVLQIGKENRALKTSLPEGIEWLYVSSDEVLSWEKEKVQVVFLDDVIDEEALAYLDDVIRCYCLYIAEPVSYKYLENTSFMKRKCPVTYNEQEFDELLKTLYVRFLPYQEGYSADVFNYVINRHFKGRAKIEGKSMLVLNGTFDDHYPIISLKNNFFMRAHTPYKIWIEYTTKGSIELSVYACLNRLGSRFNIVKEWHFDHEEASKEMLFEADEQGSCAFLLYAKGEGELRLGDIHIRESRLSTGMFVPGGRIHHDQNREEFFSFFSPGDLKPPLNVYFSGYRTAEGFEGTRMMRNLGAPYLLIADPRLQGGEFYVGSEEYEEKIKAVIRKALDRLGFDHHQLILSGLSMGTYGALYYGAQLDPDAIIVGKPVINLGSMALNETLFRPNVFPTGFDILKKNTGSLTEESAKKLNQKFWQVYDAADFTHTRIAVSYMRQDDYDQQAFEDLLSHSEGKNVFIYGKGIEGRHNDNTAAVVQWFIMQYHFILHTDFNRGEKHE